jgi:hypothetical protein
MNSNNNNYNSDLVQLVLVKLGQRLWPAAAKAGICS